MAGNGNAFLSQQQKGLIMNYKCVTKINELKEYIGSSQFVAFDIETSPNNNFRQEQASALDPHKAHIVGVSLSVSEGSGIYVPIAHKVGKNMEYSVFLPFITWFLRNSHILKIAHNLAFESSFFYGLNIVIEPPVYDTMMASMLTLKNNTEFRKLADSGLKTLVPKIFDVEMPKFEEITNGLHFDELDATAPETLKYACADSDYALKLYKTFNCWFDKFMPKHRFILEHIESPTAIYVGAMKYNGLLVDKELMLLKQAEADSRLTELKEEIAFIIGDVNIGANASTADFKNYLYKDLKLPVLKTTAKNQEAVDDEAIILLTDWCNENKPEFVQLFQFIQEYRKWGKLKSTYVDGYLEYINPVTGRIHPNLLQMGTDTGRFSCNKPNLQNCPRAGNDDIIGVRSFIIAPEGKVLVSVDLSQIELRVGAFYCRDEIMLETYRTGGDIHAQTTSVIYNIPFEQAIDKNAENYKNRRAIAKNCNFGVFFGLFPKGLQRNLKFKAGLDVTLEECEDIISNHKSGYPSLAQWQDAVKKKAMRARYSETSLGRRRYLPNINSTDWSKKSFSERCALNTPIQGTAADILKLSMGRIVLGLQERPWLLPLMQVHDELLFEVPIEHVPDAVAFIKSCMEAQPFSEFDIPIIAEASYGKSFGNLREFK